jgi:UDP-N-acetylglucosamine 1-carboxyvinyltransferase
MARFIIHGGKPLTGTYQPLGNKNAVLPMLAACLLTEQPVILHEVPWIDDVRVMLRLLEKLGVAIHIQERSIHLQAKRIVAHQLDADLCRRVRSSILLAGPMLARHRRITLYPPGGDVIGRRRVDTHFTGLQAMGARLRAGATYSLSTPGLHSADLLLDEASVTATENLLMAAALTPGKTTLYNAACEPHVQDLGALLIRMGARIDGLGSNRLTIEGRHQLGGAEHTVQPDHIEIGSFAAAAAATGGRLRIRCDHAADALPSIERPLRRIGIPWTRRQRYLTIDARDSAMQIESDIGNAIPKIEDGPWPGFPSDLMSVAIVLATQAHGTVLFFEKLFESRMHFVDQLISMGARIVPCDPHRVLVSGPTALQGAHMATPDIRAGMALLVAALCARGRSVIENAQIIDRGYEHIDQRLAQLGADITREDD